jgi:hypothetical protein
MTAHGLTAAEADRYLKVVFGSRSGCVLMAFGLGGHHPGGDPGRYKFATWQDNIRFAWPRERKQLLAAVAAELAGGPADIYICPYLRPPRARRHKGNARYRPFIHADYDNDQPISPAVITQLRNLGGFAISSSQGSHRHVYVPVAGGVSREDHERLCRTLGIFLGCHDHKVADNDVLRLPGTWNFKTGPPSRVRWDFKPNGKSRTIDEITAVIGQSNEDEAGNALDDDHDTVADNCQQRPSGTGSSSSQVIAPAVISVIPIVTDLPFVIPPAVRTALAEAPLTSTSNVDDSRHTFRVVRACKLSGLSYDQAVQVIASRPRMVERLNGRPPGDDDLRRCWDRAAGSLPNSAMPPPAWQRAMRQARVPRRYLAVAMCLATYADADGTNAFPGQPRLVTDLDCSMRTVSASLKWLRENGWLDRVSRAAGPGRGHKGESNLSDRYSLTIPDLRFYHVSAGLKQTQLDAGLLAQSNARAS